MAPVPNFAENVLEQICSVLADTSSGLTGGEIGKLLHQCGIDDPTPRDTKRYRLHTALSKQQRHDGCANRVIDFIQRAMSPVLYTGKHEVFEQRRQKLNSVLAFGGFQLGDDGNLRKRERAQTLTDAEERADQLRRTLRERGVHHDVLRFCRAELLQDNYFHAVFEATKSVADKIREKSGLTTDGAPLVDKAFGGVNSGYPVLAFNELDTETKKSEHKGLMNLLKGMFGTFRNTTAHAPKITWPIDEQDALDMLSLASLLHRRLDESVNTGVVS
jgi:uncharacterized protein (TIGR02391 family)